MEHNNEMFEFLRTLTDPRLVHQEVLIERYTSFKRADFYVYGDKGPFWVEVFMASDFHAMVGCLNAKQKKYKGVEMEYPVYFVNMNKNLDINILMARKKNKLNEWEKAMNWDDFREFAVKTLK